MAKIQNFFSPQPSYTNPCILWPAKSLSTAQPQLILIRKRKKKNNLLPKMITHLCSLRQSPTSPFVSTFLSSSPSSYPNVGAIPRRISVEPCRLRNGIICGAILPVDPWAPNIDSQSIASQVFAFSLFPYIGFLYFITKSKTAPKLTLFGFYFLLAFVGATSEFPPYPSPSGFDLQFDNFPFVSIIGSSGQHDFFNSRAIGMWVSELPLILKFLITGFGYIYPFVSVSRTTGICFRLVSQY